MSGWLAGAVEDAVFNAPDIGFDLALGWDIGDPVVGVFAIKEFDTCSWHLGIDLGQVAGLGFSDGFGRDAVVEKVGIGPVGVIVADAITGIGDFKADLLVGVEVDTDLSGGFAAFDNTAGPEKGVIAIDIEDN